MSDKRLNKTSTPLRKSIRKLLSNSQSKSDNSLSKTLTESTVTEDTVIIKPKESVLKNSKMKSVKLEFRDYIQMIRPFDGTRKSYKYFISDCERVLSLVDSRMAEHLLHYIVSLVSALKLDFVLVHSKGTWSDLKSVLDEHFKNKLEPSEIIHELTEIKRGSESIFDYYNRFTVLLADYREAIRQQYSDPVVLAHVISNAEDMALHSFVKGLNSELKSIVLIKAPSSLQEAYKISRQFEDKLKLKPETEADKLADTLKLLLSANNKTNNFVQPSIRRTEVVCQFCNLTGHSADKCYRNKPSSSKKSVVCQLCNKSGHTAPKCYSNPSNGQQPNKNNSQQRFKKFNNNNDKKA